jgi:hypothetical protein
LPDGVEHACATILRREDTSCRHVFRQTYPSQSGARFFREETNLNMATPEKPVTPVTAPARSGETVTVACKVANGVILRIFRPETISLPGPNGLREEVRYIPITDDLGDEVQYVVAGPALPYGMAPRSDMAGGYALTHNVPKDFWDLWVEQNKLSDLVKKQQVFAAPKSDHAAGRAKELKSLRSGLEPIVPNSDPRIPKPKVKGVGDLVTADGF